MGWRDEGREGGWDGGRDGEWDGGRKGGWDGGREGGREGGRVGERKGGWDGGRKGGWEGIMYIVVRLAGGSVYLRAAFNTRLRNYLQYSYSQIAARRLYLRSVRAVEGGAYFIGGQRRGRRLFEGGA